MMTRTLLARCAPFAIAASVALPAIPAAAQDATTAQPVIVLPDPVPTAAPTTAPVPTVVLPETTAPAAAQQAQPAEPVPTAARTTASRAAAPAPARQAAPRAAVPSEVRPAPATPVTTQAPAAAVVAEPAVPITTTPVARTQVANDATGEISLAALLGVLGLIAVGGVAYLASRRRKRSPDEGYETVAYEPVPDTTVVEPAPVVPAAIEPDRSPTFTTPAPAASAFATPVVAASAAASARRATPRVEGDPIPLPAEVPQTFEERDALLKELVAAEPDKANPFTGVRARARRAKLIMQSLGQDFRDRKPRIDLSEYTNRWPALRGWQPATA